MATLLDNPGMPAAGRASIAQALPFDALSDIFIRFLPPVNDPNEDLRLNPARPPLLLCHICRSWRNAALNIGQLWERAFLPIFFHVQSQENRLLLDSRSVDLLQWWDEEHCTTPPSIYLKRAVATSTASNSPPAAEERHAHRSFFLSARRLDLHTLLADLDVIFSSRTPFRNLTDIRIHGVREEDVGVLPAEFTLPPAPNLRRLSLSSYHPSQRLEMAHSFPWAQLTHVFMPQSMDRNSWRQLLSVCSTLAYGAFCVSVWRAEQAANDITMANLRHLIISNDFWNTMLFERVTFPQLETLRFISIRHNSICSLEALETMLGPAPALKELHFDLCLSFRNFSYVPFGHRTQGRRLSDLTPHLQRLVVDHIDPGDDAVGHHIIDFLECHWLCSGWEALPQPGESRSLELVILQRSFFTSRVFCDNIIRDVQAYLDTRNEHPAFSVSVRKHPSPELTRIEDFEHGILKRAWREVLGL